jgi:predicted ATPase/DNA-binding winged helix-turn-helix (wHTH) protein
VTSFSFGPFTLVSEKRLLLEGDVPIRIGDRALDILLALVERPGDIVHKEELFARVWPNIHVESSSLKVNVAALRKALKETAASRKYIAAVAGRGYTFVSPVSIFGEAGSSNRLGKSSYPSGNLPNSSMPIFGRAASIEDLKCHSTDFRLLTIVGAGGIGKTTVALAVARSVAESYQHGAWFVDFSPLNQPGVIASTVAAALGLAIHSEQPEITLRAFLRSQNLLLVFDNCEHLIDPITEMVQRILSDTTRVHIIATSREPLRARGERVYRLPPLDYPSSPQRMSAAEAMTFPAIQLFVERAKSSGGDFLLDDNDASVIGSICSELDGIALAIELAATRVPTLGISGVSALLTDRFRLLNKGSRAAPQRQQTLNAALDWSYRLLPSTEQITLQRLSLFAGPFSLNAASAVAGFNAIDNEYVVETVSALVEKSLISADTTLRQYRLLETTRAFARKKLDENGELSSCSLRHATYFLNVLRSAEFELDSLPATDWLIVNSHTIDDVRAALRWIFSAPDARLLGVALVVAAVPLWARLSLIEECRSWTERVLTEPKSRRRLTDQQRMKLSVTLALVLLYTQGPAPQVDTLLCKALPLAKRLGETEYVLRSLYGLAYYRLYVGHHRSAMKHISNLRRIAKAVQNSAFEIDGERLEAATVHYVGEHTQARKRLSRLLDDKVVLEQGRRLARFHLDNRVAARCILAPVLLVQGFLDKAQHVARIVLEDSQALGHAISIENSLVLAAVPVAYYRGEFDEAKQMLALLTDRIPQHRYVICLTACFRSAVLVARGEQDEVGQLRKAVEEMKRAGFGVRHVSFVGMLAQALGNIGQMSEARRQIEQAIRWSRKYEEVWCLPELLRIKAELLSLDRRISAQRAAQNQLYEAIKVARRQRALTWELRATIDLARMLRDNGKNAQARNVLSLVYSRFSEGFETSDLQKAARLLRELA